MSHHRKLRIHKTEYGVSTTRTRRFLCPSAAAMSSCCAKSYVAGNSFDQSWGAIWRERLRQDYWISDVGVRGPISEIYHNRAAVAPGVAHYLSPSNRYGVYTYMSHGKSMICPARTPSSRLLRLLFCSFPPSPPGCPCGACCLWKTPLPRVATAAVAAAKGPAAPTAGAGSPLFPLRRR